MSRARRVVRNELRFGRLAWNIKTLLSAHLQPDIFITFAIKLLEDLSTGVKGDFQEVQQFKKEGQL